MCSAWRHRGVGPLKIRRQYFGWYSQGAFYLSHYPADAPVRPSLKLDTVDEVKALLERKRGSVLWSPPLPGDVDAAFQKGLRLEGRQ
jgi:hypothetical protein